MPRHVSPLSLLHVVRPLLYGFGDNESPRQDTVELVEELVVEYITNVVWRQPQVVN